MHIMAYFYSKAIAFSFQKISCVKKVRHYKCLSVASPRAFTTWPKNSATCTSLHPSFIDLSFVIIMPLVMIQIGCYSLCQGFHWEASVQCQLPMHKQQDDGENYHKIKATQSLFFVIFFTLYPSHVISFLRILLFTILMLY